jgi:hypothetical protein
MLCLCDMLDNSCLKGFFVVFLTLLTSNNIMFVFLSFEGITQRSKAWMKSIIIFHKLKYKKNAFFAVSIFSVEFELALVTRYR